MTLIIGNVATNVSFEKLDYIFINPLFLYLHSLVEKIGMVSVLDSLESRI